MRVSSSYRPSPRPSIRTSPRGSVNRYRLPCLATSTLPRSVAATIVVTGAAIVRVGTRPVMGRPPIRWFGAMVPHPGRRVRGNAGPAGCSALAGLSRDCKNATAHTIRRLMGGRPPSGDVRSDRPSSRAGENPARYGADRRCAPASRRASTRRRPARASRCVDRGRDRSERRARGRGRGPTWLPSPPPDATLGASCRHDLPLQLG